MEVGTILKTTVFIRSSVIMSNLKKTIVVSSFGFTGSMESIFQEVLRSIYPIGQGSGLCRVLGHLQASRKFRRQLALVVQIIDNEEETNLIIYFKMHILGDSFFCLLMVSLMYESTLCYMHVHCTSWGDTHPLCI